MGGRHDRRDPTPAAWRWATAAPVLAGATVQGFSRAPHAHDFRSQAWTGGRDPVDGALLGVLGAGMVAAPLAHASGRLGHFDYPLSPAGRRALAAAGVGLLAGSVWLFHRSHADLGRNWTPFVQLRDQQDLVTSGVFGRVRHPMYASQWLFHAAQACLLQNWLAGPAGVASFLPFYLRRVRREEALMRARFGDRWDAYAARTGRLLPRHPGREH